MNALNRPQIVKPASPQQASAFHARSTTTPAVQVVSAATQLGQAELANRLHAIEQRESVLRSTLQMSDGALGQVVNELPAARWLDAVAPVDGSQAGLAAVAREDRLALVPARGRNLLARLVHGADGVRVLLTASAEIADRASLAAIAAEMTGADAGAPTPHGADHVEYAVTRAALMRARAQEADFPSRSIYADRLPLPLGTALARSGGEPRLGHAVPLDPAVLRILPASILPALWAAYLSRLCGVAQVPVLVGFDGRAAPAWHDAIGPYEQFLQMTFDCDPQQPLASFLESAEVLHERARQAQDESQPAPLAAAGRFTSIEVIAAPEDGPHPLGDDRAVSALDVRIEIDTACLRLDADASRFSADDLARWASGLSVLMRAAADRACATLGELPCVGNEERELLARLGRGPAVAGVPDFLAAFDRACERAPEAIAATDDTGQVTYRQLDRLSDAIAASLRLDGRFEAAAAVPILAPASIEQLCAAIGAMKAGYAFAPLDPAAPSARIRALVDALGRPPVVVGRGSSARFDPPLQHCAIESLAQGREGAAGRRAVDGRAIAYIIFTSGSTGRPKGVRVTRAGLGNYLNWAARTYLLDDTDGALVHTSPAADLAITGLFGPLAVGGAVHLPGQRNAFDWAQERLAGKGRVGLLKTTPSLLRALLKDIGTAHARIGAIVLGGEPLTGRDLEILRQGTVGARVFNEYGPTETVVGSTAFDATEWAGGATRPVPIGLAIDNTGLSVVDAQLQPVPYGAPGELVVSGAGVAAGYLDADAEAVRRWVEIDGVPAYRTGDRVQWTDGNGLQMLGRLDEEFKVNGVRCHPAEVEAALEALEGVKEAVVALREDPDGRQRLVAWYVPGARAQEASALREALSRVLPQALVPTTFVEVSEIPRSTAGKRDRARLALPGTVHDVFEAPRGHHEELLAAVFCAVLGKDRIGRNDDYFALGGDSLRSVQASALARKRGLDLSVAQIHANPVLKDLAEAVREGDPLLDRSPRTLPFDLLSPEDRAIVPASIEDAYPLNLLQEGMIYHRDFAAKSAVYHAICSYTIRANLDVPLMRRVINDLVRRHPLLRTSFDLTTYSRPMQLVHRNFEDPLTVVDLRDASPQAFNSAVDGWMEHEKRTGFEVQQHPLIRFCVHVGPHGVFQLSYSFHHEIIDGWSDALMVTELLRDYFARHAGEEFVPEAPTATFRDAVSQEQAALANPRFREFWMKEFADTQLMRLPRLGPPLRADKGERQIVKFEIPIDDDLSDGIVTLARKLAVPVKTLLLAAHMRVMSAMGGGRDTTSYTVGNGRPENAEGHRVIGLFVNSLAFRLPMPGGTWRELIRSTLAKEQSVLPYRRYPMAELKRQAGNDPLSETLFFFNHYHVADVLDGRKDAELLGIRVYGESTFPYCVNAYISPVTKRVGMRVEYDSLQFTPRLLASMERMYLAVVRAMVADPEGRYDLLEMVPPAEREEIKRHSAPADALPGEDVVARIGAAARTRPDHIAVVHGGRHMSYASLDRLAGQVSAWLARRGVRPGARVALLLPRCLELPALVAGVLRAGCAYVPLDPSAPEERLGAVLADARPACAFGAETCTIGGVQAVGLAELVAEASALAPLEELEVAPAWPAYVIYTSGTTGKPKGVEISRGALALSNSARHAYYPDAHEVFLLLSSMAFDSSVAGLFGTLTAGGTLVLPSGTDILDLSDVLALVGRHRVTQTLTVPSLYATMLRELRDHRAAASSLRVVSVAGEAVPSDLVTAHAAVLPDVQLVNEYGPTEATVWATAWTADGPGRSSTVPCGHPVAGMRCYVSDAFDFLASTGVVGEACLAGPMLAHGYVGRAADTANAFRPCVFEGRPGERMYRTGDFMRWNALGQLEFCGRRDAQVKVDGFRIELGDIEAALLKHPKVRNCAVQAPPDAAGKPRLVAYVSFNTPEADTQELGTYLRGVLPRFMLPKAYVALEQLPVGPSGKIDRAALPQPKEASAGELVTPRTPTEEVLAGIWKMVLGVERLSMLDGFFTVGGDSLRAMRIAAAMQKALGLQPPMKMLMSEGCSVADLAIAVDEMRAARGHERRHGTQDDERDLVRL